MTSYTQLQRARAADARTQRDVFSRLPPESSPRTRELVRGWVDEDPAPTHVIEPRDGLPALAAVLLHADAAAASASQPVDEFLFETREGFCEHYASAFTVMMRAAGIPARS